MASYSYGSPYAEVEVEIDDVVQGLNEFNVKTKRALKHYLETDACSMLEDYMQSHRPWTDRTSTARIGLSAKVTKTGALTRDDYMLSIELSHSAYNKGFPYGKSLEYGAFNHRTGRMNKPYPILEPTARLKGGDVVRGMQAVVERYYF